jgi:DNA replication licensing factor MCM4
MRSRGEINILLCGDPGTSKSQILGYVHKLAPRGIYTSGKGSSAVGLTAYVSRDPDTREVVLESGALVLSDRGVCCIDEFDKMSDTTRAILHECMEQQTISIAKAGIIATLNARTSILASANPIKSRYDPRISMVQNIDLPPTLLSRFDLIYLVLDKPDPAADRRLARHLVQLYFRTPRAAKPAFDKQTVCDYIAFAKKTCSPQLKDAATRKLVQGYVAMRQLGALSAGGLGKKTISATPRQLESLIRLSEAHAKVRLSNEVDEADVVEALRLMAVATQKAAVDPRTGTIDMDAITTGRAEMARIDAETFETALQEMLQQGPHQTRLRDIVQRFEERLGDNGSFRVSTDKVKDALRSLSQRGAIAFDMRTGNVFVAAQQPHQSGGQPALASEDDMEMAM